MTWAANKAATIKEEQGDIAASQRLAIGRRELVINHQDSQWDELVGYMETHTRELADELPLAKESGLGAFRLDPHALRISTKSYPLLTFDVRHDRARLRIDGTITEKLSTLRPPTVRTLNGIGFTLDRNSQVVFTDGESLLAPSVLAEMLMENVSVFFQRASRVPSLLA